MWDLLVKVAVYCYNKIPHKVVEMKEPNKLLALNAKINLDQLKRLGCKSFLNIPRNNN